MLHQQKTLLDPHSVVANFFRSFRVPKECCSGWSHEACWLKLSCWFRYCHLCQLRSVPWSFRVGSCRILKSARKNLLHVIPTFSFVNTIRLDKCWWMSKGWSCSPFGTTFVIFLVPGVFLNCMRSRVVQACTGYTTWSEDVWRVYRH